jgi:hypothetical protein
MPVNDHMKTAATELMKAVDLLKQEIDDLRSQDTNLRQVVNRTTAELSNEVRQRQQEISRLGDHGDPRSLREIISQLEAQIGMRKRQLDDDVKRITDMIRDRQSQIDVLQAQSRDILP